MTNPCEKLLKALGQNPGFKPDEWTEEKMFRGLGSAHRKKWIGNIGLAAHNRGYENNYFANIKKLKKGDNIIYCYNKKTREYVVEKQMIIEDTDWTYLEETEENTLTLITCVENEPKYRRCIIATEKVKI